jgi:hypothetical protein
MTSTQRHFVSQHLGRAVAAIEFFDDGRGEVVITCLEKQGGIYRLHFCLDSADPLSEADAEAILRMAIGHLHQQTRKRVPIESVQVLPRSAPAWPGDWYRFAIGDESSAGKSLRLAERRKGNAAVEGSICHALALLEKAGLVAARAYLKDARIAASTIRRIVLTKRIRSAADDIDGA